MAKGLTKSELNKLARIGASRRLAELEREIAALRRAFPGLKASVDAPQPPSVPSRPARLARHAAKRGRRKPMSAAERKAVSARMKRYWADRRKARGESPA
jgi:hypothetical protein